MPYIHKGTLAIGLFLIGLGASLFAVGGTGIAAAELLRGELRSVRSFLFLIVVGLMALAVGSGVVAYLSFEQ